MTRATLPNPLPVEYSTTNAGVQFLQWDSGDNERILIFATDEKLNLLEHNNNWFMDGTFDTVPHIYAQLLTIHARVQGAVIPCVYAFLPNKTQHTYVTLFRELININGNLRPASVLIDFELGIKNALVAVFPAVSVNGCFFHFTQNIWRKMQQHRYQTEPGFVIEARMIAALVFIPGVDIDH